MSDAIRKRADELVKGLVEDVKERTKTLKKLRAMTKLAKDLGEDTADAEKLLDVSEQFADLVQKRLGKTPAKSE